jgi:hypothetical protein
MSRSSRYYLEKKAKQSFADIDVSLRPVVAVAAKLKRTGGSRDAAECRQHFARKLVGIHDWSPA